MNPKDKARELVCDFYAIQSDEYNYGINWKMAKQCALIAVDEMIDFMFLSENENSFWINYYNKVKQEIEKL